MQTNAPGRGKLKVTGIIYIIYGVLGLLGSLILLGGGGLLAASGNSAGAVLGVVAGTLGVINTISAVFYLILGILDGPGKGATVEVQLRTIATDCWASLEHQIKYKRQVPHEGLVREELKRCADEIASVDLSMETIRELLEGA